MISFRATGVSHSEQTQNLTETCLLNPLLFKIIGDEWCQPQRRGLYPNNRGADSFGLRTTRAGERSFIDYKMHPSEANYNVVDNPFAAPRF